ncbi:hypothetical protein B0T25DRAFT_499720 [Lasiosphaeria hispida]|uniref:HNH nuclease domain-containing protein n=1 Tax=Lasiosphaeria hispida TaxID=260671 RepID=A0AAJ0HNU2_9PEZI|nr:hypothetical protein B0T25DRAFT_499720 [Lasiosphaeria hispida]
MSFWDEDPLADLPEITPHPGRSGSQSSELSAALSSLPATPILQQNELDVFSNALRKYRPIHASDDTSSVLQAFVDNLSGQGLLRLQHEIYMLAEDPRQLRQLRNFLVDAILKPVAASSGKQPIITPPPNQAAAFAIELAMTKIEGSTRQPGQTWLKEECLRRDKNRCVVSGLIDATAYEKMSPGERRGNKSTSTECVHILPFALSKLNEKNATHTKNKATIWLALHQYFPALEKKIGADMIHQPGNAMTLASTFHKELGRFTFGFQAMNEYRIEIWDENSYFAGLLPTVVTFAQHDAKVLRPDPDVLDAHLRIGRILKVSGIGRAVHMSLGRYERRNVDNIASDGSTNLERILGDKMLIGI